VAQKPGLIASILVPLLLYSFLACLFEGVGNMDRDDYNLQGHFGAIANIAIGGMFGAAQPLLLRFPLDRGIFLREYATNTYSVAAYFLSKTMVEAPQGFLNAVLVWATSYFIAGLQGYWILHVCVFWLSGLAAGSTALVVGCLAANAEVATQASPPIFVLQLLFAGVFLPVSQVPAALRWIQWVASLKYAINLNILIEFGEGARARGEWSDAVNMQAQAFIERNEVKEELWWFYLIMILVLITFFRSIAIFALARRAANFF